MHRGTKIHLSNTSEAIYGQMGLSKHVSNNAFFKLVWDSLGEGGLYHIPGDTMTLMKVEATKQWEVVAV
jgi:hypothetical protein